MRPAANRWCAHGSVIPASMKILRSVSFPQLPPLSANDTEAAEGEQSKQDEKSNNWEENDDNQVGDDMWRRR